MRVAVLSDIHGVLPALEAVLAEPDVTAADLVVLTGDLAAGPQPAETIDMLRALGDRAVWVRGNADRELVAYRTGEQTSAGEQTSMPDPISPWAAEQLTPRTARVARRAAALGNRRCERAGASGVLSCDTAR